MSHFSQAAPNLRVVIPCRNAISCLPDCLRALDRTMDPRFKIVVVNDGCNPGLDNLVAEVARASVLPGGNKGAGLARNAGAAGFHEGIIVFVDADVVVDEDTIRLLIAPILSGDAEATVGNYSRNISGLRFPEAYKQLYISHVYSRRQGRLENQFWTALGAVRADSFHKVGGFSPEFTGAAGEDHELGIRLSLSGARILAVPEAQGRHLKRMDFLGLLRNDLRKGRMETYLHLRHRSKFTNNRHANPRDIHSVTLAFAAVAGWILAGSMAPPSWSIPASAFLLALYLVRRADLIGAYLGKGTAFLAASLGTLFLLDLVRGLSVFLGATRAFRDKLRLFRSPSRFPVSASEEPAVLHHAS